MRLQPIRRPVAIGDLINPRQRREKHRDLGGIPSARGRIFRAERVGLQLVLTAVFQEHGAETSLGKLAERPNLRHEDAADEHAHGCDRRPRILLRGMARGHVPDFMPEHTGQLGLIVQIRQNAARDVDVAARNGERIDNGRIEKAEVPAQGGELGNRGQALADRVHVPGNRRVAVEAVRLPAMQIACC